MKGGASASPFFWQRLPIAVHSSENTWAHGYYRVLAAAHDQVTDPTASHRFREPMLDAVQSQLGSQRCALLTSGMLKLAGFSFKTAFRKAIIGRGDLSDAPRKVIGPILPAARGLPRLPAGHNRCFLDGTIHVLRVGCSPRDLHERDGEWNSVCARFRRRAQQGVRDVLVQTLGDLGLADVWQNMIDSTGVRGHVSEARKKREVCANARGRSRGGVA